MSAADRLSPRWESRRVSRAAAVAAVMSAAGLAGVGVGISLRSTPLKSGPSAAIPPTPALHGQATWAPGIRPAPAIDRLRDQSGHVFSLAATRGQTVAIVFFDSLCTQACPLEGRALSVAEARLAPAKRPVLVAVSVNPRDTAASTKRAAAAWGLAGIAPWHWLMGNHARLAAVWSAYHIYVGRSIGGDIPHTEAVYLVDRRGYERSAYLYPFVSQSVSHDLGTLANERQR